MKIKQLLFVASLSFLFSPTISLAQVPVFGAASGFAVFSSAGAFANAGPTVVTGDVGNNAGAFAAFPPGTLNGQIHSVDAASALAASDLDTANAFLNAAICGAPITAALGSGQVLTPGIYCQTAATLLTGDLTLDAQGDANAVFIIKFGAAFTTSALSTVTLINSTSPCNVYWQVVGAVILGDNSSFTGTIVGNAAITLNDGASLTGRVFTTAGAVSLTNNVIAIAVMPTASVLTAGGATTFCAGANVTLSGNNNGVWNTNELTPAITIDTTGDYFVSNSNTFCTAISNHIIVMVNPLPTVTIGSSSTICYGDSAAMGAVAVSGHSYSWTPSAGLSSAIISDPMASPADTTVYYLTETISATGCNQTDSVTVTVNPLPNVTTTTNSLTITATLAGAVSYQWITCPTNAVASGTSTAQSYTATTNSDYAVIITNGNCADTSACVSITTVGIHDHAGLSNKPTIFPNPSNGSFSVVTTAVCKTIIIADVLGNELMSIAPTSATTVINLNEQVNGVYFVKTITDKGQTVQRVVINK